MPFGLFEKPPQLIMTVDRPQGPYYPGDVIHVTLQVTAGKPTKINEVRAVLLLRQRYKELSDTTDATTHQVTTSEDWHADETEVEKQVPAPMGTINGSNTYTVDLHLPTDAAPPYLSDKMETHWVVKGTVDVPMAGDANEEIELALIVPPPGARAQAGNFGMATNPSMAGIHFELGKLEYVNGETLLGRLVIEPHQDQDVREVRLEVIVDEKITEGVRPNDNLVTDQKIQLAGQTHLTNNTPVNYPFSLPLSTHNKPTTEGTKGQTHWSLKATMDCAWAGDNLCQQEIWLYSAARKT